uniref:Uncharacterized protein n=1 Tax=Rhizophora mucronata TaxID=61149 RepID=A0A2P2N645_RHIMU
MISNQINVIYATLTLNQL